MSIIPSNALRYCPMCNTELTEDNFYESKNPHHNGRLLYCKKHCDDINKYYTKKTKDEVKGLWFTCAELGVPFVSDAYKRFIEIKQNAIQKKEEKINPKTGNRVYTPSEIVKYVKDYKNFAIYYDLLKNKMKPRANDWSTFYSGTDVDWSDVSANIKDLEVKESEKQEYLLDWGLQDTYNDYQFLDNVFSKYTKCVEFINPQQEDLYRDLCRDRLLLRKINDGRYRGDESIDNIQKRIDRTMTTLKVNNFEDTKPKTLSEQTLFEKIRLCNENNVEDVYKEPTKHFDLNQINKYEKDMCLRPTLKSLLGHRDFDINIDNINFEEYNLD